MVRNSWVAWGVDRLGGGPHAAPKCLAKRKDLRLTLPTCLRL